MQQTETWQPKQPSELQTAVLFIPFSRPSIAARVFDAICRARPPRLYIAVDAPHEEREGEAEKVRAVRRMVERVDWPCDAKFLFQEQNLGTKYGPKAAIDWFFEHEEEGIILEEDCLPTQSFFWFCEALLHRYRHDTRVWSISGTTTFPEHISMKDADYIFSRHGPIWGLATWRRTWQYHDIELADWPAMRESKVMENVFPNTIEREAKRRIGDKVFANEVATWDYQFGFLRNYHHALTVLPSKNQVVNIGFGPGAANTIYKPDWVPDSSIELEFPIRHPKFIVPDVIHDEFHANTVFSRPSLVARLKRRLFSYI